MEGGEVALAALGIMGTVVGYLVLSNKQLFAQNNDTIKKLTAVLSSLEKTIAKKDIENEAFQTKVCQILDKISTKQDEIHETVNTINTTNMNVETIVVKRFGEDYRKK